MYNIALESEKTTHNVSQEDLDIRNDLIDNLMKLPEDVIVNLRELQPESGCFNQCSFCGVSAGKFVFRLNDRQLANLFAGIKFVGLKVAGLENRLSEDGVLSEEFRLPKEGIIGYGPRKRRVGVIYPYEDNDITSYPLLDKYVKYAMEDLGVKTRITTVGYNRKNKMLQKTNENVNRSYKEFIGALRFSFTPYTFGWSSDMQTTSKQEFLKDLSNTLRTYRPSVDYLLGRNEEASFEFRFRSLIRTDIDFSEEIILKKHVINVGPYLLISMGDYRPFKKSVVNGKTRHSMIIDGEPQQYLMAISNSFNKDNWNKEAEKIISRSFNSGEIMSKKVNLYMFENYDGVYYSADPMMTERGLFGKYFYPKTELRPKSGYIDSERYFLNTLLAYKKERGISKSGKFDSSTFTDIHNVVARLRKNAELIARYDRVCSEYINREIVPLVDGYVEALETAGYEAKYFFNPHFTINAGSIRNLGRAFIEYKGLASKPEMAVTAEHESRYGKTSFFAGEGKIWRIAPLYKGNSPILLVEAQDLYNRTNTDKGILERYFIPFGGVERLNFEKEIQENNYVIPGQL
jgi:hypothetical protein